jgi:hypothetical protein
MTCRGLSLGMNVYNVEVFTWYFSCIERAPHHPPTSTGRPATYPYIPPRLRSFEYILIKPPLETGELTGLNGGMFNTTTSSSIPHVCWVTFSTSKVPVAAVRTFQPPNTVHVLSHHLRRGGIFSSVGNRKVTRQGWNWDKALVWPPRK